MMTQRRMSPSQTQGRAARLIGAIALSALATWSQPVRAQSCPGGYAACDNGGCCLNSDQCCPMMEDGCCPASTPFCCGDGTCAASPPECASAGRNTCTGYDIPCGRGCAPAGSHCCDPIAGYYCAPQGICTSPTKCRAGDEEAAAKLVVGAAAAPPASTPEAKSSPLVDPPDGIQRSCALRIPSAAVPSAAVPSAAVPSAALPFGVLSLILAAAWVRRRSA